LQEKVENSRTGSEARGRATGEKTMMKYRISNIEKLTLKFLAKIKSRPMRAKYQNSKP
jgi:hypothetical protein